MNLEELEGLRKKARNIMIIGSLFSIIFGLILFYITELFPILVVGYIVGFVITNIIVSKAKRTFLLSFKDNFVLKSLQSVFTDLSYEPEKGISEYVIRDTQMMDMGDRYSSNDYISAKYKNINVVQSDVHIEEKHETRDSDGNRRTTWVTIFKGRWMIFDFNKNFKANIQVCQKGFGNSKLNNWGKKNKYTKVMLEDQTFNNCFKTYAQSEHDAFYILTPALMEKIKNLSNTIKGKILLCFINNQLHVGIQNNKDSFEHSIYRKINEDKVIDEIIKDIKLITNFVDELDLDNDLFRKGV